MPAAGDLAYLGAAAARGALASGAISAVDYISALLERIDRIDPQINAFLSVSREGALRSARHADRRRGAGHSLSPLHGLPFAIKDLIDVRGLPTTAHSRFPAPPADKTAAAVLRLQRQGAICIGKLGLEEFGIGSAEDDLAWPSPRNPWDMRRATGGSSSGAAVALAAGLVPLALGTDTAGSVRAPAAFCGLVALKPTNGRIDMRGVIPLAPSLDVVGPMARSAADCAMLFGGLAASAMSADSAGSRIGVVDAGAAGVDADVADAMAAALAAFESLGAGIGAVDFPYFVRALEIGRAIRGYEAYAVHRAGLDSAPHLYGATCRRRLRSGAEVGEDTYRDAMENRVLLRAEMDRVFERCDVLAMPVTFGAAPLLDDADALERSGNVTFRMAFNVTGHPAIVFCTGYTAEGLPLSMQLVGRHGEDARLLDLVMRYQEITPWHAMHPAYPFEGSSA